MARRKKGHGGGHESSERWLLTYADMITLLLALFILLYAMSSISPKKFDSLKQSLSSEFHGQIVSGSHDITDGSTSIMDSPTPADTVNQSLIQVQQESTEHEGQELDNQTATMQQKLAKATGTASPSTATNVAALSQKGVQVALTPEGIDIKLSGDTFFEPGSATLNPGATATLTKVADQLKTEKRFLSIEGHTDGTPYSGIYGSNLGLSSNRADTVANFLMQHGDDGELMKAQGWGDTRPAVKPPTPTTPEAQNRSVDIVITTPQADAQAGIAAATGQGGATSAAGSGASAAPITPIAVSPQPNPIGPIIDTAVAAGNQG